MAKGNSRVEILDQARRALLEGNRVPSSDAEDLLKLLNVLIEASERESGPKESAKQARLLAGNLIENKSLLLTLKQQADELDALKKLSLNLTSSLDLQTVLDAVVTEAMRLIKNAQSAHIFLYANGKLEFGASLDQGGTRSSPIYTPRKDGITINVAKSGERIIVEDMHNHPLFATAPEDWTGSIIGIPLKINHMVVGVMNLSRTSIGGFNNTELRLISLLSDQAAVAISNASLHQMVSQQAYSDTVTTLPNRRALDEQLEQEILRARRSGNSFAVVMMDLDGFKVVNDTYGHTIGDQVLRTLSSYLASGLRSTDFLARYGGDEFTLILSQTDPSSARVVMEKILEKIEKFFFLAPNHEKITLGLSSGIAVYPIHAITPADLLRAADEALYRAKKLHRGSFMLARGFTGQLNPESA